MTDTSYQPTLAGLRAFAAVAEKHHFSLAAAGLGLSQSTLSQALSSLETGLGIQLIERSTRRVFLTAEGQQLLPHAHAVLDAAAQFSAAAAGVVDPLQGSMRLGLIPTVAPYVLPAVLAGLSAQLPELHLRVVEDQTERLLTGLREGAVDAALMALPTEVAGVTEIPLYDEDFVLALPPGHALAGKRRLSPTALADLPLLLLDEGHCLRDQALEICRNAGVRAELATTRAASLSTAVQCVNGGLGVTLIPQTAVAVEAERNGLALAYFAPPRPGRRIGLVFRTSSGRDESYRRLAGIIGDLIAAGHRVDRIG
ncbi:hydrogen peroxide-inducible genes activator [[Mycobacterium] kokjensenii]|uniref:Probable hydrogen peroxide-inducible genes activator n=1 Tax=[Mycobacterium] kokjensenii TaxID=3064287 RepID=A0ABM9LFN6_9MYCO|nr:hydrogen peroxide-inducible genes activator [Mycolicibacter sp. MU0083]CAJ1498128.1 hydrogen peroxide-inducible genes activator [Mycolicibacter sp. MU0083]